MTRLAIALCCALLSGCVATPYRDSLDSARRSAIWDVGNYARTTAAAIAKDGGDAATAASLAMVRRLMKDPDSAKFENVELVPYGEGRVVCGRVNAKNSYGGYAGFQSFVAGVSGAYTEDTDRRNPEIAAAFNAGLRAACGYR